MAASRPLVHVIATGGSISGLGPHRLDYTLYPELGKRLSAEEMLARVPEASGIAEVKVENLLRVGSSSIGPAEWLQLGRRIDALLERRAAAARHRDHPRHGHPRGDRLFPSPHGQVRSPGRADRRDAAAERARHRRGPQPAGRDSPGRLSRRGRPRRAHRPEQRDPERARRHQDQCLPREHVRQPRLRLSGLRRRRRAGALLPRSHPSPHQRHALRRARRAGAAARRHRVRLCRRRRCADRRAARARHRRRRAGRLRRRHVSRRLPSRPASARCRRASRWCSPRAPTPGAS